MTPTVRLPLLAAALLAVAACTAPTVSEQAAAVVSPPTAALPATNPNATEEPDMICQAEKGQWAIGQIADETLVAKVKADTTSGNVRVIRPGMAVTMDYRVERVNLDVDADNRVTAVRCT